MPKKGWMKRELEKASNRCKLQERVIELDDDEVMDVITFINHLKMINEVCPECARSQYSIIDHKRIPDHSSNCKWGKR